MIDTKQHSLAVGGKMYDWILHGKEKRRNPLEV